MEPTISNNPTPISGAVLSYEGILDAIAQKRICIRILKEEGDSKKFDSPDDFEEAIDNQQQTPQNAVESAGYLMYPDAYWDGTQFVRIGRTGYELRPNQHAVIKTYQWIKFSKDYCALHFGLHRYQMIGVFIGSGQIQPGWGHAPLYITIWNSSKVSFLIRRDTPLSRLVFLPTTSSKVTGMHTTERIIRETIEEDLVEQTKRENRRKLLALSLEIGSIIVVVAAFFLGAQLVPLLAEQPHINSTYAGLLVSAFTYLVIQVSKTVKGPKS